MMMGMTMGILVVELVLRWRSKCISSVTSRTASRNILFSSATAFFAKRKGLDGKYLSK